VNQPEHPASGTATSRRLGSLNRFGSLSTTLCRRVTISQPPAATTFSCPVAIGTVGEREDVARFVPQTRSRGVRYLRPERRPDVRDAAPRQEPGRETIPAVDLTSPAALEAGPDTPPVECARHKGHLRSTVDLGADRALLDGREEAAPTAREVLTRTTRALQRPPGKITFELPDSPLPRCQSVLPVGDGERRARSSRATSARAEVREW
jgi:hypothetical protein